ncbi:uncharacterized protein LOC123010907 [Tribolium madens]|uniref:uncharacterized protein LOC123010907 n=1 Tax=Tribolium madens TaxID=41895 RepID=UPI001CF722B8|nr:uncharacterized protein LOC123010907 [Tribolium madens]
MNLNPYREENENVTVFDNFTNNFNGTTSQEQTQEWIVAAYFALQACGGVLNVLHILALIRSRRNGILSLILQISLVDLGSLYVGVTEILTLRHQSWYLSPEFCPFFKGTEVLVNTLTIYLIICFNFHVISLWNLHEIQGKKTNKNPLTSCDKDDSNECLVAKQENANRLVTIDYSKRKDDVSIVFPIIFVWIVSLSLSVPNFTLSSTLKLKQNYTLCAVIDSYYGQVLQHSLVIFKIALPVLLLFLSLIILTIKLTQTSTSDIENVLTKKMCEIRKLLIFGIVITIAYFLTSFQRQFLHFIHVISHTFAKNTVNNFKMPPLYNSYLNKTNITYLAMLHYFGCSLRSLLCLALLPKFPYLVRSKILICYKIKE